MVKPLVKPALGGVGWRLAAFDRFLLGQSQFGPGFEIKGQSGHAHLVVGVDETIAGGMAGAKVADQAGNGAFDLGPPAHLEGEGGGGGVKKGSAL